MRRLALVIALAGAAARADSNDLQLYRLGHPDPLACTLCDGSPGDPASPGSVDAQARYHRLASTLGLAFVPPFQETAGTVGLKGFEAGLSSSSAFLRVPADTWPSEGTQGLSGPPQMLVFPTLAMRKGLGGSLEVGAAVSWLARSRMIGLSGEIRWAPLDGLARTPDVALRAYATRVIGAQDVQLTVGGADVGVSKSFGVFGMMKLQPYAQGGVAVVHAVSADIDFQPLAQVPGNPTADHGVFRTVNALHNRYARGSAGVRLVTGPAVIGVEGSFAIGTNQIQDADLTPAECGAATSCAPPSQVVRLWSASARLGLLF